MGHPKKFAFTHKNTFMFFRMIFSINRFTCTFFFSTVTLYKAGK